ncbi:MAG: CHAT domain-containing protein [Saprospiraceae bacterium]|nr:CHAT domain-containing protein [Saprospiraceae bacterium]
MRRLQLFLSLLFFCNFILAQLPDSLILERQLDSLLKLSRDLCDEGKFDSAHLITTECESFTTQHFGSVSINMGKVYYNRAWAFEESGKYEQAESWYIKAKEITATIKGTDNIIYAVNLNSLGALYFQMGLYNKAEPYYLDANQMKFKIWGPDNPRYTGGKHNLGILYHEMGEFEKAEAIFLENLNTQARVLGKKDRQYAASLNSLAILYDDMGNFEMAEKNYLESILLKEETLGEEHPSYSYSIENLADLYLKLKNYSNAEKYYLQAIRIREKTLGNQHPHYATSIDNYGLLKMRSNQLEIADSLFSVALNIRKNSGEQMQLAIASSYEHFGEMHKISGNYSKAESFFEQSFKIRKDHLNQKHPDYLNSLYLLADINELQNQYTKAEDLLKELFRLSQEKLKESTAFLSEAELNKYMQSFLERGHKLCEMIAERNAHGEPLGQLTALCYDFLLFHKGFVMIQARKQNTYFTQNSQEEESVRTYKSFRRKLNSEYSKPLAEQSEIAELEAQVNLLEKSIAKLIWDKSEFTEFQNWKSVQAKLKAEDAALEFLNFPKIADVNQSGESYACLVLKKNSELPVFVPLFEKSTLDSMWGGLISEGSVNRRLEFVNDLYTYSGRGAMPMQQKKTSLYELIVLPLKNELNGIKNIYFSPSGLLHQINFQAIPISDNSFASHPKVADGMTVADIFNIFQLSSTRNIGTGGERKKEQSSAALFGGIVYDLKPDSTIQNELVASRGEGWNYLPGTEREVSVVKELFQDTRLGYRVYSAHDASELNFKKLPGDGHQSPILIHLATHGFFFTDGLANLSPQALAFMNSQNPMMRSGLILAGANERWTKNEAQTNNLLNGEDGILTALEISQMNLLNTDLVVLSACETGLGAIKAYEGVYGLQRAFKIAGVKYVIMSLWQVPDKQTGMLMTRFYKYLCEWYRDHPDTFAVGIPQAFQKAQKELRDLGLDPYQWAGFVLVD